MNPSTPMAAVCLAPGAVAQTNDDVEAAMSAHGARITLPVGAAHEGFDKEFVDSAREQFSNFHIQLGGDHALYNTTHITGFAPAAFALSSGPVSEVASGSVPSLAALAPDLMPGYMRAAAKVLAEN